MAKLTSQWIKYNFVPARKGILDLVKQQREHLVESLLAPHMDSLPQAPKGYRVQHQLGGNFSAFFPLKDVYDRNGRTGDWQSVQYTDEQYALIKRLDSQLNQEIAEYQNDLIANNDVVQRVLKEQDRLLRKYNKAYNRIDDAESFNSYLESFQDNDDVDPDQALLTELETTLRCGSGRHPLNNVLWDDFVDFIDDQSEHYADLVAE